MVKPIEECVEAALGLIDKRERIQEALREEFTDFEVSLKSRS